MSSIADAFKSLRARGDGAYIAYVCAGDPEASFTVEQVQRLVEAGADLIELGMPFSDPIADGPVIQAAMNRSLSAGFRTESVFGISRAVRERGLSQPIVIMTYYNPVLQFGARRFCSEAAEAGVDGLLIVDLPPEESEEMDAAAGSSGLDIIRLVAPSTSSDRLQRILSRASGFVYAVSTAGTTGARESLPASAAALLSRVVPRTELPVALGFGISTPSHVQAALSMGAAAVVEGSRMIATYSGMLPDRGRALDAVGRHAREMKDSTVGGLVRGPPRP